MKHAHISRRFGVLLVILGVGATLGPVGAQASGPPPHGKLEMTGDVGEFIPGDVDDPVHDPAIVEDPATQTYYVFSTLRTPEGPGGIFMRRSTGTLAGAWESMGEIAVPERTKEYGHNHLWAPDVARQGNTFYLYYSASSSSSAGTTRCTTITTVLPTASSACKSGA